MPGKTPVTVTYGDGIDPEITQAVLRILDATGAEFAIETIESGEAVYRRGNRPGLRPSAWELPRRTGEFLKAPVTTPAGAGFRSFAVAACQTLGLYAGVRPCVGYDPFVETRHPHADVAIVQENKEDLDAGTRYRASAGEPPSLKVIARPGCERIVRHAFACARQHGRGMVTCFTKDNAVKMSVGLSHRVFAASAGSWTSERRGWRTPRTPSTWGRCLVSTATFSPAWRLGSRDPSGGPARPISAGCAMFEAKHGPASRRAGQNLANPAGLLPGAVLVLEHIDRPALQPQAEQRQGGAPGVRRRVDRTSGPEAVPGEASELSARGCAEDGRRCGQPGGGAAEGTGRCERGRGLAVARCGAAVGGAAPEYGFESRGTGGARREAGCFLDGPLPLPFFGAAGHGDAGAHRGAGGTGGGGGNRHRHGRNAAALRRRAGLRTGPGGIE